MIEHFVVDNDFPLKTKALCHIQGIARYKGGWILSRNGDDHGELISNSNEGYTINRLLTFDHAGGIDTYRSTFACVTYGRETETGCLHVGSCADLGSRRIFDLDYRPYAVGIEKWMQSGGCRSDEDDWVIAIVAQADGTELKWYRWREHEKGDLEEIDTWKFDKTEGARNNITLGYTMDQSAWKKKRDMLTLYTMRAHIGYGVVTRYLPIPDNNFVLGLRGRNSGEFRQRSGLCSIRFGSTVIYEGGSYYLIKTARNVWKNKLRMAKNRITWDIDIDDAISRGRKHGKIVG